MAKIASAIHPLSNSNTVHEILKIKKVFYQPYTEEKITYFETEVSVFL